MHCSAQPVVHMIGHMAFALGAQILQIISSCLKSMCNTDSISALCRHIKTYTQKLQETVNKDETNKSAYSKYKW